MRKETPQSVLPMALKVVAACAAAVLLLVPAAALVGSSGLPQKNGASGEFVLAWGNDGGCPALAIIGNLPEASREAVVLLPGSSSDGASLRVALQNHGVDTLAALFMPTGSPFPRGANSLLRQFGLRRLIIAEDSRSRTDWKPVQDKAMELGAVQERIQPDNGRIWHTNFGQWNLTYHKLPDSEIRGTLKHVGDECQYVFENRVTGEFILSSIDADGNSQELFCQPRTNRNGSVRIPIKAEN